MIPCPKLLDQRVSSICQEPRLLVPSSAHILSRLDGDEPEFDEGPHRFWVG